MILLRSEISSRFISFIDNRAGLSALSKGFGRDTNINNLLGLTWNLIGTYGWHLHLAWVSSENNISDKVSRQDDSDMNEIDAQPVSFKLDPLFKILCRVADDSDYAHGQALQDIVRLQPEASALPEWKERPVRK